MKRCSTLTVYLFVFATQTSFVYAKQTSTVLFSKTMLTKPQPLAFKLSYVRLPEFHNLPPHLPASALEKQKKEMNYLSNATFASLCVGVLSGLVGYGLDRECGGSSDVFQVCHGSTRGFKTSFVIGSALGSMASYKKQTDGSGQKRLLPIVLGTAVGGISSYYLAKNTVFWFGAFLPPVATLVSLKLFKYEF